MRDSGGSQSLTCVEVVSGRCELTGWPADRLRRFNTQRSILSCVLTGTRSGRSERTDSPVSKSVWTGSKKKKKKTDLKGQIRPAALQFWIIFRLHLSLFTAFIICSRLCIKLFAEIIWIACFCIFVLWFWHISAQTCILFWCEKAEAVNSIFPYCFYLRHFFKRKLRSSTTFGW